jgi:hypothetical protein
MAPILGRSISLPFVIRIFEHLGWATGVHWPVPTRLDRRRRDQGRPQAAPVLQDSEALIPPAPG